MVIKNILVVIGTRPEAIKMAPVILALRKKFNVKVCLTGQHDKLLMQVIEIFNLHFDYNLKIMKRNQNLFLITQNIISKMQKIIKHSLADLILVHGDTSSSTIAALSGFYMKIKVGHVEAGLRTYDKFSPFPEEINRQLTARLTDIHFAPTKLAKDNLIKENINPKFIFVTGNTVVDSLNFIIKRAEKSDFNDKIIKKCPFLLSSNNGNQIILVTGHRRENFGFGLKNICMALKDLSKINRKIKIIYSVHPNPNISQPVNKILGNIKNIYLIPPQNYLQFVKLMSLVNLIITDSGGIQEEAPSLNKPVLITREFTERPEGLKIKNIKVVGSNRNKIFKEAKKILNSKFQQKKAINPYGNGFASEKIFSILRKFS